jgi:tetratricopeptide (TPR) repeat protein
MWHYARGRAQAAKGAIDAAQADLAQVRAARNDKAIASQRLEFNTSGQILGVAAEVLAGHIAQAKGDKQTAVTHLRKAAQLEDALVYGEPPEWSVPVRQELGLVLLEAARYAEAERAFKQDLERFPKNSWSVAGLREAASQPMQSAASGALAIKGREAAQRP